MVTSLPPEQLAAIRNKLTAIDSVCYSMTGDPDTEPLSSFRADKIAKLVQQINAILGGTK